jgi:hypothetical protein
MKSAAASTRASPVPVYSPSELLFGDRIVGGVLRSSQETGARSASSPCVCSEARGRRTSRSSGAGVAGRGLAGAAALAHSRVESAGRTEIRFREHTIWERYRPVHHGAAVAFAAQAILIGALLVQRERRNELTRLSAAATRACAISARGSERAGGRAVANREGTT